MAFFNNFDEAKGGFSAMVLEFGKNLDIGCSGTEVALGALHGVFFQIQSSKRVALLVRGFAFQTVGPIKIGGYFSELRLFVAEDVISPAALFQDFPLFLREWNFFGQSWIFPSQKILTKSHGLCKPATKQVYFFPNVALRRSLKGFYVLLLSVWLYRA